MSNEKIKKILLEIVLFIMVMFFTFYFVFRNQNGSEFVAETGKLSGMSLGIACFLAFFSISMEGIMIWYLLKQAGEENRVIRCIGYSFTGFFFSGLTPSATGGQPVQLYYMKKDGNSIATSSVVLMTVALIYKFVLVIIGCGMLIFGLAQLKRDLGSYLRLYGFGLLLNVLVVIILLAMMWSPDRIKQYYYKVDQALCKKKIWKESAVRRQKVEQFLNGYQTTIAFLKANRKAISFTIAGTFLQRGSMIMLPYVIYRGMGLSGASFGKILFLQAAIYIAVDLLPIPGAQGITEAMYHGIFGLVFPEKYLLPSLCITRGINFYLMMLVSLVVWWSIRRKSAVG